jgi:hypothetical protein
VIRDPAPYQNDQHPEAPAPRPDERAEEHRDQDGKVPAGCFRMMDRTPSILFRRGVMRIHRDDVHSMAWSWLRVVSELVLVAEDPMAQEQRRHQQDDLKPSSCRARGDGVSYAASV